MIGLTEKHRQKHPSNVTIMDSGKAVLPHAQCR